MENNYFRYVNQKCPVCDKPFAGDDDIVVCPVCGTPHHRDCYKKNGECANSDRHRDGYRWSPEAVNSTAGEGGNPVPPFANETNSRQAPPPFAEGAPYNSQQASSTVFFGNQPDPFALFPKEIADGVLTEEAAEFVQVSSFKYVQKFFYNKSGKKTWNWAAFFFAPYWFFYRKLHKLGAIFTVVLLLISICLSLPQSAVDFSRDWGAYLNKYSRQNAASYEDAEAYMNSMRTDAADIITGNPTGSAIYAVQGLLIIGVHVAAALIADKQYYKFTVKKIRKIKEETADENQRKLLFFRSGGLAVAITIAVLLGVELFTTALSLLL
ncbi:MAG: RING finger protein [Candidatus Fimenecus sp.]